MDGRPEPFWGAGRFFSLGEVWYKRPAEDRKEVQGSNGEFENTEDQHENTGI